MSGSRQIIALGSGFSSEAGKPSFLPYILEACGRENPRLLYLPTASGDTDGNILGFYETAARIACRPSHLSLFRQPLDLPGRVESADIIYVGGGNTRNLIALWRASGLDLLLRAAWERGTVLCGESAGGICWFENAQTTSTGEPGPVSCLGFLTGSCSTHYDTNPARRPHLHAAVAQGLISPGYALDENTGLHFLGTELHATLACQPGQKVYRVDLLADGSVSEQEMATRLVGPADDRQLGAEVRTLS